MTMAQPSISYKWTALLSVGLFWVNDDYDQYHFHLPSIEYSFLAVILAVLIISIILLALARYFVSRKHKQDKDEQHYIAASNRSALTRYPPTVTSSGYPITAFDMDLPVASIGYGTNRRDGTF